MENHDIHHSFTISSILSKYTQQQTLEKSEREVLNRWLEQNPENRQLFRSLADPENLAISLKQLHRSDTPSQLVAVRRRISRQNRVKKLRYWMPVAAALLLILGSALFFFVNRQSSSERLQLSSQYGGDALPGTNRATLTLSSGKAIHLDEHQSGIVSTGKGLSYENGNSVVSTEAAQSATLSTPRGGQYKITLSDGTLVWLNAGSSLDYPVVFNDTERRVRLKGEAYFEVKRAGLPFVVQTQQQQINVLGTAFNVRAYSETETTALIHGKVAIRKDSEAAVKQLSPGQLATVKQGKITVQNADLSQYTAWKEGLIMGSPIGLTQVAEEIERWYDVDFVYPDKFSNSERAYVSIGRNEKLSSVLRALEHTYGINFKIRGKEVIIE